VQILHYAHSPLPYSDGQDGHYGGERALWAAKHQFGKMNETQILDGYGTRSRRILQR
jgi:hypothetical protein